MATNARKVTTKRKKARSGGQSDASALERKISHAVNHPIRLDALSILFERVASPKEITEQLRQPLATVSFHILELVKDTAIDLVKTVPRRGAVEHYYKARVKPEISDEEMRALPKAARRKLAAVILQGIIAEGLTSLRHGKMEADDDLNLVWMPMTLSAEGRAEVSALQAEMYERLEKINARDASRSPNGDEDTHAATRIAAMLWFERGTRRPVRRPRTAGAIGQLDQPG